MNVASEKVVTIHYTLRNTVGEILDSSEGQDPMAYIHGTGNLIPKLELALLGRAAGDKMSVEIAAAEAYGVRDESLVKTVPLTQFRTPGKIKEGARFQVDTPDGTRIATVTRVDAKHATVDMNHPLAGENLLFDVEIVAVRDALAEELAHGHVHGPGGHHHH